jgi:perosamine synthetase
MIPIAKPFLGKEEKKAVLAVLNSGMLAQGPKVKELEAEWLKMCGVKHALALSNGTSALHACLYALGLKPGDEVITTPFTFVASANCILMQGAKPVFADVEEKTFNIDPEAVLAKITDKTRAILPVDLYGQIYDHKAIKEIAEKYNLFIVEDACQAVNAELDGRKAGSFGDMAAFSLYATKNVVSGEGGMVTTDNDAYAELVKRFRHHGQSEQTRYEYHDLGYNYRMTDLQAAIAIEQLKKVEKITSKRIRNAKLLTKGLKQIPGLQVPYVKRGAKHVFHQYTLKVDGFKLTRDQLVEHLKKNEIGSAVFYPKPLHLHPHFARLGYNDGDFPVAEKLSKQVMSLPVHPSVSKEDIARIITAIKNAA